MRYRESGRRDRESGRRDRGRVVREIEGEW